MTLTDSAALSEVSASPPYKANRKINSISAHDNPSPAFARLMAGSSVCLGIQLLLLSSTLSACCGELEANLISRRIQELHVPFGLVVDPVFTSPTSNSILRYTRGGDAAIWTGHYLAAEAFRYQITKDTEAFANAQKAVAALQLLTSCTGGGLLARCSIPRDSPWLSGIVEEEAAHGIYRGRSGYWIGGTSRDQYLGVFFGLCVAYDMIGDDALRTRIRSIATELLEGLLRHHWNIVMPDGRLSTTFWGRPDQQATLLQITAHMDPPRWRTVYLSSAGWRSRLVSLPIRLESLTPSSSYFKYNLANIDFYHLLSLERDPAMRDRYAGAYEALWNTVKLHGNAFFNVIRFALGYRDVSTGEVGDELKALLQRPVRDLPVDLRTVFRACGWRQDSCDPIPIDLRVSTDFLWQRSPFQLRGGGAGLIESAGIDYLLPYWMARHYSMLTD